VKKDVSFLHIADIHFNSKFLGLNSEKRSVRKLETQFTLKRLICDNNDAKIILFAGDIFDGETDRSTITFLCKLFEDNPDKHFFLVCGNHDYLTSENIKLLNEQIPSNVHIFSDAVDFIDLKEYAVRIYGCSFSGPHCSSSLLENFHVSDSSLVNIMLMHGEFDSTGQYNPLNVSQIPASKLDYLALGHEHTFSGIKYSGKTAYAYPGILEPRGFDECGKCGVIKGKIVDGTVSAEFLPSSLREYRIIEVDITNLSTNFEIVEKINSVVEKNNLYRIVLCGQKDPNVNLELSLYEQMADVFYCEIEDKTKNPINILEFSGENTLIGKAATVLQDYIEAGEFDAEILDEVADTLAELLYTDGIK